MSQHVLNFVSPKHGMVEVILGWDPAVAEFFVNVIAEKNRRPETVAQSKPGAKLDAVASVFAEALGQPVPPELLRAVAKDESDWRVGEDVGRRYVHYGLLTAGGVFSNPDAPDPAPRPRG